MNVSKTIDIAHNTLPPINSRIHSKQTDDKNLPVILNVVLFTLLHTLCTVVDTLDHIEL